MPTIAPAVFGTFLASFVAVWAWRWLARRLDCYDVPNERSSHHQRVPSSGGIAFATVFLLLAWAFAAAEPALAPWLPVYLTAILVLLTGLVDDLRGLGIGIRLFMQILTLALALANLPFLPTGGLAAGHEVAGWGVVILLFLFCVWFINLYNFMDGIDALAGSEAVFASLAFALFSGLGGAWELCMLAIGLAACVAGFLAFNLPPASLFMGDAGSNFLGFMLLVLGLQAIAAGAMTIWTFAILFGVFIVDSSFTLLRRMLAGELWYHGHRSHAYQRAAGMLASHGKVVAAVALLNICWLLPLAWLSTRHERAGLLLTLVAWVPLLWLSLRMSPRVKLEDEAEG